MDVQFTKLKLTGFKSFVESTELWIEPGLTGVVGPNGCGKSNLVEALRWVMGETSPKNMRGGGMEDVIFGGTDRRPARNIAEVTLYMDNTDRNAPAQYNITDEIEVNRRIGRGDGSNYRVNGTDVRAKDVQTLFADAASGARSTALVSQGRIGALIASKPTDRRNLLEEAAGITGLHSRRHEAELRLRSAETNLERLDDVLGALEEQLKTLNKQARQAKRYKNLGDHIRRAEAIAIHHQWMKTISEKEIAIQKLSESEESVQTLTMEVAKATSAREKAANEIPSLREKEAAEAAALQRLIIVRTQLEKEESRIEEERTELAKRIAQISDDREREINLKIEAESAVARLTNEIGAIEEHKNNQEKNIETAKQYLNTANIEVRKLEQLANEDLQKITEDESQQTFLNRQISEAKTRQAKMNQRLEESLVERQNAEKFIKDNSTDTALVYKIDNLRKELDLAISTLDKFEHIRIESLKAESVIHRQVQDAETSYNKLVAEENALKDLLTIGDPVLWPPLIDSLNVENGYELALSAALGDDLNAPLNQEAPIHWKTLAPFSSLPPLPNGLRPLSSVVEAPNQLSRRLSQVGIVEDEEQGDRLAGELSQGQRLVSPKGGLWRWDGYTIVGGTSKSSAVRLTQRNRLKNLRSKVIGSQDILKQAKKEFEKISSASKIAIANEKHGRNSLREAERAYHEAREAEAISNRTLSEARLKIISSKEKSEALLADLNEVNATIQQANDELLNIENIEKRRTKSNELRKELIQARNLASEKQSNYDRIIGEAASRKQRLEDMIESKNSWLNRIVNAEEQLSALEGRMNSTESVMEKLRLKPKEISIQRTELLQKIKEAEEARTKAANNLSQGEKNLSFTSKLLREVEVNLGEKREDRVRCEATKEQIDQALEVIFERSKERIMCEPDNALSEAGVLDDKKLPTLDQVETRVERLKRERDNMGAINLRAEQEATELNERIQVMVSEREDLISAISRLRQGITNLNREGRTRLLGAFEKVNNHFTTLFTSLFGGGKAYLSLTEADDPLEAGLEIMASPPGKKMQTLSLLSGGEQALTAIALLFAVFLTNPAPICVLDEVDAPLDDANVERFCQLIQEISEQTNTRFLLVTHHRLTMARMDRLFGVTMSERGVSQLVSVDLQAAEHLRESA